MFKSRLKRKKIDGKEITLTLEDALMSPEFLRIMMGGQLRQAGAGIGNTVSIRFVRDVTQASTTLQTPTDPPLPTTYKWMNITNGKKGQNAVPTTAFEAGDLIRFFYDIEATGTNFEATEITISPNEFPGTYKIIGQTLIRAKDTGADESFQLVISKAKVSSAVTLTMQAEGDPSTFNMTITVLKDEKGEMMKLIKYQIPETVTP